MRPKKSIDEQITEEKLQTVISENSCGRLPSPLIFMQKHQVQE